MECILSQGLYFKKSLMSGFETVHLDWILFFVTCMFRCTLWRRCCRGLSVWFRDLLALGRQSPLPPSSTTCPDKATGKTQSFILEESCDVIISVIPPAVFHRTVPVLMLSLSDVYVCPFADPFWCVLPVTLPWTSWLRRSTRPDWRSSGCVPRAGRPSSHQCPSWLCTTRSATWTGRWRVGNLILH